MKWGACIIMVFPENDWSDNYSEACKWLSAVSEKDHPLAKKADILLAKMYYSGKFPERSSHSGNLLSIICVVRMLSPVLV